MKTRWANRRLTTGLSALGMVTVLALAGCAEKSSTGTGSSGSGGGASGTGGVAAGSSMDAYKAAFANVDAIKLKTQTPAPKGAATGLPLEKYYEAVTEWSGGKITWDVQYSNAVAAPAEADNALNDGRLDVASVLPIYEPDEYPANNALIFGGFISDQSAVQGALSSNAWPNAVAFGNSDIMKEYDDHGMVALVPVYNSGANGLFCSKARTGLSTIKGASVGAGGVAQTAQVQALGGSASSVPYPELFESLQRGVVDCTVSSPTVAVLGGFAAEAPHVVIDPEAGFALAPGTLAVSKTAWDGLPLVAKQLLWDKLGIFIASNVADKVFPNNAEMAKAVKGAGGSVTPFDADARAAMQATNEKLLTDLRSTKQVSDGAALVDTMTKENEAWQSTVNGLGFEAVDYKDFDTWYTAGKVDLTPYADAVMKTIFDQHRPS